MNLSYWSGTLCRLKSPSLAWQIRGPSTGPSSVTSQLCASGKVLNLSEPQYSHLWKQALVQMIAELFTALRLRSPPFEQHVHKHLHSRNQANTSLGASRSLVGLRTHPLKENLPQSRSPSPGSGWRHVPGPPLGSRLGSDSAVPGQGGWCGQWSHCCHCGQIASSLQMSEGAWHTRHVRAQSDITPHTAQHSVFNLTPEHVGR